MSTLYLIFKIVKDARRVLKKSSYHLIISFTITSCGFSPIYDNSNDSSYKKELKLIKIQPVKTVLEQEFRNKLIENLDMGNMDLEPKYLLEFKLTKSISSTFTTSTGSSGRNKIYLNVSYSLKDLKTQETLFSGHDVVEDFFNVEDRRFANYISEKSIEMNLTKSLADSVKSSIVNNFVK